MKRMICRMLVLIGLMAATSGCNTFKGVGRDVEDAGSAIKDAAS
jgi:predicted small secreted protein